MLFIHSANYMLVGVGEEVEEIDFLKCPSTHVNIY